MANTTFNNVKIDGLLTVNKIRFRNDKTLNLTPQNKLTITTRNMSQEIEDKYLLFNAVNGEYGYGMCIDNDKLQIGYGTREQFNMHNISNAITINQEGISVDAEVESISSAELEEMLSNL